MSLFAKPITHMRARDIDSLLKDFTSTFYITPNWGRGFFFVPRAGQICCCNEHFHFTFITAHTYTLYYHIKTTYQSPIIKIHVRITKYVLTLFFFLLLLNISCGDDKAIIWSYSQLLLLCNTELLRKWTHKFVKIEMKSLLRGWLDVSSALVWRLFFSLILLLLLLLHNNLFVWAHGNCNKSAMAHTVEEVGFVF